MKNEWIKIEDQLPGFMIPVQIISTRNEMLYYALGYLDRIDDNGNHWTRVIDEYNITISYLCNSFEEEIISDDVLFWMPLPEPPEVK